MVVLLVAALTQVVLCFEASAGLYCPPAVKLPGSTMSVLEAGTNTGFHSAPARS